MIGEGPSLIEILPPRLKEALDRELHEGEEVVLAVRGNPREALAATSERLLTLREGSSSLGPVTVEAYSLAEVTGLALRESGAEIAVTWSQPGHAEPVVLGVPSYDAGKFRRVTEVIRGLLPAAGGGAPLGGPGPGAQRAGAGRAAR